MLDIKFVRENPDVVKQNIKNKFQESKLELVDEVIELDQKNRDIKNELQSLQANRNKLSKQIGALMGQGKKEEAEEVKKQVTAQADRMAELSADEKEVEEKIRKIMMVIPNIIAVIGLYKLVTRALADYEGKFLKGEKPLFGPSEELTGRMAHINTSHRRRRAVAKVDNAEDDSDEE